MQATTYRCPVHPHPVSVLAAATPVDITCITFSEGWNGLSGTKGVYVASTGVTAVDDCTPSGGACGYFNSTAGSSMRIPLFANAMDAYNELSISLWFKRTAGHSGRLGLVGNGECGAASSVGLTSDENGVNVLLRNDTDSVFIAAGIAVS